MIWIKQGVIGDLQMPAQKGLGKVARLYADRGHDMCITCFRDGNHGMGSFHYIGMAFDFRKAVNIEKQDINKVLGKDYDVIEHATHYHVEYDPKG